VKGYIDVKFRLISLLVVTLIIGPRICSSQSKKPLGNQDVIDMVKAGLDEKTISKAIETSETVFDTTPQTLILLKNAGVSDGILSSMLSGGAPKAAPSESDKVPKEVGIYWVKDGNPSEVGAEVVNFRTGGVGKMILTDGLDKGHTNGVVNGPHSKTQALNPAQFIIVTYEGVTASEYLLVRLDKKNDRREFRQETGGVFHKSSGAGRNEVGFDAVKLAPRTYRVKLGNLTAGEYGFLPPIGPENRTASANGRIYSFSILE
jgi:hypothetical protein